jgi:hypothetical protein
LLTVAVTVNGHDVGTDGVTVPVSDEPLTFPEKAPEFDPLGNTSLKVPVTVFPDWETANVTVPPPESESVIVP